jgi:hypothetical protein
MGQYWAVDTSGPYSPAIITGAMFKTVFIELVCRLMVSFYHVSNDEKSILEIIRKFDDEILGLVKAKGILPIFLKSDNGSFKSNKVKVFCVQKGIVQRFTAPYHSSSNGDAERALGKTRFLAMRMIAHSDLGEGLFWEQADRTALWTLNRLPYFADGEYQLPPIVQWTGEWPWYAQIRRWGCPAVVTLEDTQKDYSKRGIRGIHVG